MGRFGRVAIAVVLVAGCQAGAAAALPVMTAAPVASTAPVVSAEASAYPTPTSLGRVPAATMPANQITSPPSTPKPTLKLAPKSPPESTVKARVLPRGAITAANAAAHVGSTQTVCGKVIATYYAASSGTTFLDFGRPYPNQVFKIVIFREWRSRYSSPPETKFLGRYVCDRGSISRYAGVPQILDRGGVRFWN